jgi:hypothetical protein
MSIRPEVRQLVDLGPLPSSDNAEAQSLDMRAKLIADIPRPVSREEALALMVCFGPDDAFGVAWSLLHLIETALGGVPFEKEPSVDDNEWVRRLWNRSHGQ